jgi:MFS family permease
MRGSPRDALIADGVVAAQRGKAFGFHRAMDTSGAVVGPLIGLVAYEALDHRIRPLLWIAVIPAVLSVALVALARDPKRDRLKLQTREAPEVHHPAPADPTTLAPLPPAFRRVVAVLTAFSLVNFPDALLLLRLHSIGFSVAMTILAYATYNIV